MWVKSGFGDDEANATEGCMRTRLRRASADGLLMSWTSGLDFPCGHYPSTGHLHLPVDVLLKLALENGRQAKCANERDSPSSQRPVSDLLVAAANAGTCSGPCRGRVVF